MEDYKKKYEDALERAKKAIDTNLHYDYTRSVIEGIFTELKESEDDRMKKEIIRIIKGELCYTSKEDIDKYIAWIEKQGKSEDTSETSSNQDDK